MDVCINHPPKERPPLSADFQQKNNQKLDLPEPYPPRILGKIQKNPPLKLRPPPKAPLKPVCRARNSVYTHSWWDTVGRRDWIWKSTAFIKHKML